MYVRTYVIQKSLHFEYFNRFIAYQYNWLSLSSVHVYVVYYCLIWTPFLRASLMKFIVLDVRNLQILLSIINSKSCFFCILDPCMLPTYIRNETLFFKATLNLTTLACWSRIIYQVFAYGTYSKCVHTYVYT